MSDRGNDKMDAQPAPVDFEEDLFTNDDSYSSFEPEYPLDYRLEFEMAYRRYRRRRRLMIQLGVILLLGAVGAWLATSYLDTEIAFMVLASCVVLAASLASLQYLSAERERMGRGNSLAMRGVESLRREIAALRAMISLESDSTVDYDKIIRAAVEAVDRRLYEKVIAAVSARYGKEVKNFESKENMDERLRHALLSLNRQLELQNRKANLNLVLGAAVACLGFGVLGYLTVWGYADFSQGESTEISDFIFWYLPKLTFVVIIEVFSYFFLNLYKAGLGEIKFFQNEIVNLESKVAAVNLALFSGNPDSVSSVVTRLARTERNFILKKSEKNVSESEMDIPTSKIADSMVEFLKAYRSRDAAR